MSLFLELGSENRELPSAELKEGLLPSSLFRRHDWDRDTVDLGEVPTEFVRE